MESFIVWRVDVAAHAARLPQSIHLLDRDERARAQALRRDADRIRFAVGRVTLRELLGAALGSDPVDLAFSTGEFGKPRLREAVADLHFNTSHGGDWVLHAISRRGPVGVDVEAIRPSLARVDDFAAVLSEREIADLRALGPAERERAMGRLWTRKEAYVKALGEGAFRPLASIDVGGTRDGAPFSPEDRNPGATRDAWRLMDLPVDGRHAGCVAWWTTGGEPPVVRDYRGPVADTALRPAAWRPPTGAGLSAGR